MCMELNTEYSLNKLRFLENFLLTILALSKIKHKKFLVQFYLIIFYQAFLNIWFQLHLPKRTIKLLSYSTSISHKNIIASVLT